MNDVDPVPTSTHASEPPGLGEQPRRRSATRFTAAPSLVLTALAVAPLAAAVRIASRFADPQTVSLVADDCENAFTTGAFHTLKWPKCGGD